eukprot:scaffold6030_cov199-Amphora_coffeaeformis.AAC.13
MFYFNNTSFLDSDFCAGLPPGYTCGSNDMCASGACVGNVCQESLSQDLEPCDDAGDCTSSACGMEYYSSEAPRVCCSSGTKVKYQRPDSWVEDLYCADLSLGIACGADEMCVPGASGQPACAYPEHET